MNIERLDRLIRLIKRMQKGMSYCKRINNRLYNKRVAEADSIAKERIIADLKKLPSNIWVNIE